MTDATQRAERPRVVLSLLPWAILAPFLVTTYGGFDQATTAGERAAGFLAALVGVLLLLPAFLGAGAVERRVVGRPLLRVAWIALAIVVMAVGRPLVVSWLHALLGVPPVDTPWWLRFVLNTALLTLTAVLAFAVVIAIARRRAVSARLDLALAGGAAEAAERSTARLLAEFEERVAAPVRAALARATAPPFDRQRQEEELRAVAHDVIRPLSHHVFEVGLESATGPSPTVRQPALRRFRAAPPWAVVLVFAGMMYPSALIGYGPLEGLGRLLPAVVIAFLGCWLLGLLRLRGRTRQLLALIAGYLVIGVAIAFIFLDQSVLPLPPTSPTTRAEILLGYWIYTPLGFTVVAVLIAIAHTELAEAEEVERERAELLLRSQRAAVAARLEHDLVRGRLARVLHNQVQGEVLALALRLRLGSAGEEEVAALTGRVERMLKEAVLPDGDAVEVLSPEDVERNARLAIESWSRAIRVECRDEPEVWAWLAERPQASAVLLDAAVEGLTNAVRHGASGSAALEFRRTPEGVRLELRSPGRLRPGVEAGFGIADLRRRGARAELSQDGGDVLLAVDLAGD